MIEIQTHNIRFTIDFSEVQYKKIENMMFELGFRTKKDLLNYALSLLDWYIEEKKKGHKIASIDEKRKKYNELSLLSRF